MFNWRRFIGRDMKLAAVGSTTETSDSTTTSSMLDVGAFLAGADVFMHQTRQAKASLYRDCGPLGRALRIRAQTAAKVPWDLMFRGDVLATEADPTKWPWWFRGTNGTIKKIIARSAESRIVHAKSYLLKDTKLSVGDAMRLRWLMPQTITAKYDDNGELTHFERKERGKFKPIKIRLDEMVWTWVENQFTEREPQWAPLDGALCAATLLLMSDISAISAYKRGPQLTTIVIFPSGTDAEEMKRIIARLRESTGGFMQAGQIHPMVTDDPSQFSIQNIGINPAELAVPEIQARATRALAMAMDIPLAIMSSDEAHMSVSYEDHLLLFEQAGVPDAEDIIEALNEQWLKYVPPAGTYRMVIREDRIDAVIEKELQRGQSYSELSGGPILSLNEARVGMKKNEVPGGDSIRGQEEGGELRVPQAGEDKDVEDNGSLRVVGE